MFFLDFLMEKSHHGYCNRQFFLPTNKSIELPNAFGSISCLRINRNKTSIDQTIGVCKNKLQHTGDPFKSHINYTHIHKKIKGIPHC